MCFYCTKILLLFCPKLFHIINSRKKRERAKRKRKLGEYKRKDDTWLAPAEKTSKTDNDCDADSTRQTPHKTICGLSALLSRREDTVDSASEEKCTTSPVSVGLTTMSRNSNDNISPNSFDTFDPVIFFDKFALPSFNDRYKSLEPHSVDSYEMLDAGLHDNNIQQASSLSSSSPFLSDTACEKAFCPYKNSGPFIIAQNETVNVEQKSGMTKKKETDKYGIEQQPPSIVPVAGTHKKSLVGDSDFPTLEDPMKIEVELSYLSSDDEPKITDEYVNDYFKLMENT